MDERKLIVRIDGRSDEDGMGTVLVYRLGDAFEMVLTEEHGADAAVLLGRNEIVAFADAVLKAANQD